jgi:hypothetical protein
MNIKVRRRKRLALSDPANSMKTVHETGACGETVPADEERQLQRVEPDADRRLLFVLAKLLWLANYPSIHVLMRFQIHY